MSDLLTPIRIESEVSYLGERLSATIRERRKHHAENLLLWENGWLNPTEPDDEERSAVKRELKAAIAELDFIERMLK